MSEVNPHHPVTRAAHDQWHKLCAIIMHKLGATHVEITDADVDSFNLHYNNIGISDAKGHIEVFLLTPEASAKVVKQTGGMPWQG